MNIYLLNIINPYTNYVTDLQGFSDLGFDFETIYQWRYNIGRYKASMVAPIQYIETQQASKKSTPSIQTEACLYKYVNEKSWISSNFIVRKTHFSYLERKVKPALSSSPIQQPKNKHNE